MKSRVIYLSGPMTGLPEFNYPAFHAAAAELRAAGHKVYNPAEYAKIYGFTTDTLPIRQAFAEYSQFICLEADTLALLPGWERSKGVSAEKALAENCGLDILPVDEIVAQFKVFRMRTVE